MSRFETFFRESSQLQKDWTKLMKSNNITKRKICDLVYPFQQKYGLTDLNALDVARGNLNLAQLLTLYDNEIVNQKN